MSNAYDIDAPADMELLGGTDIDTEAEEVAAPEPEEVAAPAEEVAAVEEVPEEEEQPQAKRDSVIPRARFDEVNAKLHAAREEAEQLRAALSSQTSPQQASNVDVDALEDEYFDAILEGDKTRAKTIRATINAEIYSKAEAASTAAVSASLNQREAKTSFENAVAQTVAEYPFLDSNSTESSPEAIANVVEWRDFYIAKGDTPADALQKAAQKVAPLYAPQSAPQSEPLVDKRKHQAIVAGAKTAASQPPRVDAGVGNRTIPSGDSIIGNQDKWEKASEADRMRYLQ